MPLLYTFKVFFSSQGTEVILEKLKSYTTSREVLMKSWIMEKLEAERQFNRRDRDLLMGEVHQRLQLAHLSRWSAGEHGQSSLNERGLTDLKERLRDVKTDLATLQRTRRMDEMESMAERLANMERQIAKMEEERAQERKEMAEQESERKSEMEEQRVRERRKLAEREIERESEMDRRIMLMEEERMREKKELIERMVQQMEDWRDQRERIEFRQAALVRVVHKMEAWIRKRDDYVLHGTEAAIMQMEDRFDQIEDTVASIREDGHLMTNLESYLNMKVSDMENQYSEKFLEIVDQIDKSFKELTNRCLLKASRTYEPESMLQHGHGDYRPESATRAKVGSDKRQRARGRRRQDSEPLLSSTESCSTSHSTADWPSEEEPSRAMKGKEKRKKRGFLSCLFKKKSVKA